MPSQIPCDDDVISISDNESSMANTITKNDSANNGSGVLDFESIYGSIPDGISCSGITFDKREFARLIMPKLWVIDNVMNVFLMLLNQETVLALDTVFITMLRQTIRNNYISIHVEFLDYFLDITLVII